MSEDYENVEGVMAVRRFGTALPAYLVLLLVLGTLPDGAVTTAAFGLVVTAVVVAVAAPHARRALLDGLFGVVHGPESQQRRRGSFRRQQRPDEAGRPLPRAPGLPAGAF